MQPIRLTVLRIMILVVCLAATMAAFRIHISLGSFVAFVAVVGPYRAFSIEDRCRSSGCPLSRREAALNLLVSLGIAEFIVGASAVITLLVMNLTEYILPHQQFTRYRRETVGGHSILIGLISGFFTASYLRKRTWTSRCDDRSDKNNQDPKRQSES
jgi:hypothetical protein